MDIKDMTLEQLQDYAIQLIEQQTKYVEREQQLTQTNSELLELNKTLQKRNNDLFMKVEQQVTGQPKEQPKEVESCEDFAKRIIKGDK